MPFCFRAHGFLKRGTVDAAAIELSQKLSLFLATKNKIRDILKEGLEKIQGFDELMSDVVNLCCKLYEQNMYLLPKDKHMLLKVRNCSTYRYWSVIISRNIKHMDLAFLINLSSVMLQSDTLYSSILLICYIYKAFV